MPKIHPGHEVLSLFGMAHANTALNQVAASRSLAVTLVSAFLIVLLAGLILAVSTGNFTMSLPALAPTASASITDGSEPTAYQPSQAIRQEISRGYLFN